MKSKTFTCLIISVVVTVALSCSLELQRRQSCHAEMIRLLRHTSAKYAGPENAFDPVSKLPYMDSLLRLPHSTPREVRLCNYLKANILLELGREKEAIRILKRLSEQDVRFEPPRVQKALAMAYMRLGERSNCVMNHASESCIMPITGLGIHQDEDGSRKAIDLFQELVRKDPKDLESRWLLNLAYMTLGEYPNSVPPELLIPGMTGDTAIAVAPFEDVAGDLGLDIRNMAGGSITEDFDNDGLLDILTSSWGTGEPMHYFKNKGDGTFKDLSDNVGLEGITGGLNMLQADYNNDGYKDVFVLRGAWKRQHGQEPNSLLRNNGDGTFTDVTTQSGLLSFHPTQTATWNDFNNDGWVDLFIGNESVVPMFTDVHPCELYINNGDGTFREIAIKANCSVLAYVKGVTSGDFDNDGWQDIFVSTMLGERKLLRNRGNIRNGEVFFEDVTASAGLDKEQGRTFPTWFWDYDNDGWLDIFACDYTFEKSLAVYAAAEKLGFEDNTDKMLLYRNNRDGTFTNVANEIGLDKYVFAMGSNFGDIDNDGFLDMYLGTGNPLYQSLIPNKMFKNIAGKRFADVTTSARVGHLQKGHAVSFADMDNDGDQDIYVEMGGAYPGDAYQNAFFLNPGQGGNRWICLTLEGRTSNRSAIGTRLRVTFRENGVRRSVYRDVNSGGSFGSSPLRREIGIGEATIIDEIEIRWHGSGEVQVFRDIQPNQFLKIREGDSNLTKLDYKPVNWILPDRLCYPDISSVSN